MSDNMHGGIKMVAVLEQEQENLHQEFLLKRQPEFTHANFVGLWLDYKDVCHKLLSAQREYYLEQEIKRSEYRERINVVFQMDRMKRKHEDQLAVLQTRINSLNDAKDEAVRLLKEAREEIESLKEKKKKEKKKK